MGLTPAASFEDRLGDACEALLGKGASDIAAFVAGLNEMHLPGRRGERWTEALLRDELACLGRSNDADVGTASAPVVTQPFVAAPATVEEVLRTGLLDLWYLVARSDEIGDRPTALKRLSRNLVVWRDAAGLVHALEDYCPHRGAPLSLGTLVDGRLSCAYHGFEIDATGTIAAVPATADCPLVGRQSVRVYPVREIAGAIWVYFSEKHAVDPPEPALPEELTSPEWSSFLFTTEWRCNWQVALDNRVDPIHGSFLHSGTFTLGYGRKDAELQVEPTAHGFQTVRDNQRGVNIDWHEVDFRPGNMLMVRTEIPYPQSAGGGSFRINGHPTPIDENTTFVWFFRSRKISGWQRDLWRFLYVNRLEARAFTVVEQDRRVLEAIPLEARRREQLAQSDIAVGRMRRLVREEAERQVAARSPIPETPVGASL